MKKIGLVKKMLSYLFEVPLKKYPSDYSGELQIAIEHGKKVLNTARVNYSYNSLHRVFKTVFKKSGLTAEHIQHTLILGLGGGSIIQILREDYQIKTPITAVEIDQVVIAIARNEFGIDKYEPLEIIEADALKFVKTSSHQAPPGYYDLICVDVFINENVPKDFLSIYFLQNLTLLLRPNGYLYFNIMLPTPGYAVMAEDLFNFISSKKVEMRLDIVSFATEENNRVLTIRKHPGAK